jgi:hypothetical protein
VLFEMLTGRRAFSGEDVGSTLAAVLKDEPDWKALPKDTPPLVRELVERCLRQDPRMRLPDMGAARIAIQEHIAAPPAAALVSPIESHRAGWLSWTAVGAFALVAVFAMLGREGPTPRRVQRFSIELPEGAPPDLANIGIALSPDGSRVVYAAAAPGERKLYMRAFDQLEAQPIPGTEGAVNPCFSPDGEWFSFFSGGDGVFELMRISIHGGAPLTFGKASRFPEGSWGCSGTIVYTFQEDGLGAGLFALPAGGGPAVRLTAPDRERGEARHGWPHFFPGERAIVFSVATGDGRMTESHLAVLSPETGEWRTLVDEVYNGPHRARREFHLRRPRDPVRENLRRAWRRRTPLRHFARWPAFSQAPAGGSCIVIRLHVAHPRPELARRLETLDPE